MEAKKYPTPDISSAQAAEPVSTYNTRDYTSSPLVESYWNQIKNLNPEMKLLLINRLSSSLLEKETIKTDSHWADEFNGMWKDNFNSAEAIIEDIRNSRTSNREIDFDL